MSTLWSSSIGKKVVMSLSGLFLILFMLVHMGANLFFFGGQDAYNAMCTFMDTNPLIQIMVPVLALGFFVHIAWATFITLRNRMARPVAYKQYRANGRSSWESRNMYVLGIIVLGMLAWHLNHFWAEMQWQHFRQMAGFEGNAVQDPYGLVVLTFSNPIVAGLYIVWVGALWLHLRHGFWSAFQTVGLNNQRWIKRWKLIAEVYAVVVAAGFISIPAAVLIIKYLA